MYRGTFRYDKWCAILDAMKSVNLLSYDDMDMHKMSYADFMAKMIRADHSSNIKTKVAEYLGLETDSDPITAMEWLGLFSNEPINREKDSPFEVISDLMIDKMMIKKDERDMVAMQHLFIASYGNGSKEMIKSNLLDFGTLETDTSIARTVALPAACSVDMILKGKIKVKGVHIPVIPEIYNPILDQLETLGIKMEEHYGLSVENKMI
jgi:saccharopine dehydrogenase-like NADP-dependent oxidoreductase